MKTDVMVKFKKAMSMVTLLLAFVALVIASIGASFSFAWFSETSTAEIQEVNFNSQAVTNIGFQGDGDPNKSHGSYKGQHAFYKYIDDNKHEQFKIILADESDLRTREDRAYECSIPINVTASNLKVNVDITSCKITTHSTNEIGEPIDVETNIPYENIKFGFTWYMVPHINSQTIYTPKGVAKQTFESIDKSQMKPGEAYYYLQEANYIKLEETDNLELINNIFIRSGIELTSATPDITLDVTDMKVDLILVFCPEELYWGQYKSIPQTTFAEVYGNNVEQALNIACFNDKNHTDQQDTEQQLYYSKDKFKGSSFLFNVQMSKA